MESLSGTIPIALQPEVDAALDVNPELDSPGTSLAAVHKPAGGNFNKQLQNVKIP
ncbi:hypothetical protein [Candidatus Litorirhabdus singularis]|uniref:hypothetical protein n=1 Tax=Candidatus Litorirhabdus singularis TaxID=2518993 RepID=UPI00242D899C|nr:hypothetical protein [Candidatus Litorirhabdus singularis]